MTEPTKLTWEKVANADRRYWDVCRAKVPGGWLVVLAAHDKSITFVPDPNHEWNAVIVPSEP